MLKKIIIIPLFVTFLSSCTILSQNIAGDQKIKIRIWQDSSPDILEATLKDTFALDVDAENIIDFDVKVFGETVYLAYTTDQNVKTAKYPSTSATLPPELLVPPVLDPSVDKDIIYRYSREEKIDSIRFSYSRVRITGLVSNISKETLFNQETQNKKGVWVRMFKGTLTGSANTPKLIWKPLIVTEEPMEIGKIAILPLENQRATILAATDDGKVIVFNDVDQNGEINTIEKDLLKTPFKNIDQINTWTDGDKTYAALVADNHIITGYYQNLIWFPTTDSDYKFDVKSMQVKMGSDHAYGVWMNETSKELIVAIYQDSTDDVSRRWLEIDTLSAIKAPILNISTYKNSTGIHEDVYIGTVNRDQDFFQLFNIKNLQTFYTGPIISGWNERYAITGNELGQLLYVRSNYDQQLIFAGLNAFKQWDPIQLGSPPPVGIHPDSELKASFLNNSYSLTVFKQENGSIYLLGGVK